MAITVNWATKVINIPKSDTQLVQSSPIEIRSLDIDWFRLQLKAIEGSEEGAPFLDTHSHNTTVTVGGVTLARVVEIINGYTITFENGSYAVNLVGANSNISDVLNLNNVQVRSANSAGLTYSKEIENQSFLDGRIYIDTDNGLSGTLYPRGTLSDPVDSYTDAKTIRSLRGLSERYLISGALTFGVSDNLEKNDWLGVNSILADITLSGGSTLNTVFNNVTLSGTYNGHCLIENSVVNGATNFQGDISFSGIKGTITFPSNPANKSYVIHDSYSLIAGTGSPIIDFNSATSLDVSIRNYSGAIELRNLVDGDVSIDLDSGSLVIDASCTGGTIVITGTGSIIDNSAGSTVVTSSLLSGSDIAFQVWGSRTTDYDAGGTFGGDIATKADVQASAATEEDTYTSGSIVFGTLNTGTIANTTVRNNSYWVIDEHAVNGLTVEMSFNLVDAEHKAGSFTTFGRYDSGGNPSHYMELWAFNVEASQWELMHERFMEEESTDMEYRHAYSERHINRDSNNEVKFRFIHNVTTYNAGHALYLDHVYITSVIREHAIGLEDIIAANLITK